jgi:hypothetical protein
MMNNKTMKSILEDASEKAQALEEAQRLIVSVMVERTIAGINEDVLIKAGQLLTGEIMKYKAMVIHYQESLDDRQERGHDQP